MDNIYSSIYVMYLQFTEAGIHDINELVKAISNSTDVDVTTVRDVVRNIEQPFYNDSNNYNILNNNYQHFLINFISNTFSNIIYSELDNIEDIPFQDDVVVTLNENGKSKLIQEIYKKSDKATSEEEPSCNVCLYDFQENDKITNLPCKHFFHTDCVDLWFNKYNHNCPVCRKDLHD